MVALAPAFKNQQHHVYELSTKNQLSCNQSWQHCKKKIDIFYFPCFNCVRQFTVFLLSPFPCFYVQNSCFLFTDQPMLLVIWHTHERILIGLVIIISSIIVINQHLLLSVTPHHLWWLLLLIVTGIMSSKSNHHYRRASTMLIVHW